MRVKTLQILWHYTVADVEGGPQKQPKNKPIFSANFHHSGLLFTSGADRDIKVGRDDAGDPTVAFVSSMSGHSGGVNCLRFSPLGDYLASASDSGEVVLWQRRAVDPDNNKGIIPDANWRQCSTLPRCKEVQDLAWAPDSTALLTGSVENQAVVWDIQKRKQKKLLEEHLQYVQGVAWDPLGQYVVTQSNDRTCKIYGLKPPGAQGGAAPSTAAHLAEHLVLKATLVKAAANKDTTNTTESVPGAAEDAAKRAPSKPLLFRDETLHTFFRRLAWSPEGSVLVVPTGVYSPQGSNRSVDVTYVFARGHWSQPVAALPVPSRAVVAVRFCPLAFALRKDCPGDGPFRLPYRMAFAVVTLESVLVYDTQSLQVLAMAGPLHLAPCTDLTWAPDGSYLAVTSEDGYCSIIAFEKGELGEVLPLAALPAVAADCLGRGAALRTQAASRQAAAEADAAAAAAAAAKANNQQTPGAGTAPKQEPAAPRELCSQPSDASVLAPSTAAPANNGPHPSPASAAGGCKRKLEEALQSPPAPGCTSAASDRPLQASGPASASQERSQMRRITPQAVAVPQPVPAPAGDAVTAPGPAKLRRIQPTPIGDGVTPAAPPAPTAVTGSSLADPSAIPAAAAALADVSSPSGPGVLDSQGRLTTPTPATAPCTEAAASGSATMRPPRRITPLPVQEPGVAPALQQPRTDG